MVILTLALLISCDRSTPPAPVSRPNVLLAVEGTAQLKRVSAGWKDAIPVGFGTLLRYDDLLTVDGQAQVLCGDLSVKTLQGGTDSCPCPPAPGRLTYKGADYRNMPANVPYIQHPRNTLVLEERPRLRWHATGATSYTVALVQSGEVIWQQADVTGNVLTYPDEAPTLESGVDYLLVVQDNDTGVQSDEDPARGIGFRVASETQRDALAARCDDVSTLVDLDGPARDYALALCYATWAPPSGGRRPWGQAWLLLESVTCTHDTPAVHLWRGDLLAAMLAGDDAAAAYRHALQHAEALGDLESQATAHAGLWRVTGDATHQEDAIELYEQLGDDNKADALRQN